MSTEIDTFKEASLMSTRLVTGDKNEPSWVPEAEKGN
jgi:hypothetical protein